MTNGGLMEVESIAECSPWKFKLLSAQYAHNFFQISIPTFKIRVDRWFIDILTLFPYQRVPTAIL